MADDNREQRPSPPPPPAPQAKAGMVGGALDRDAQRAMLLLLQEAYPNMMGASALPGDHQSIAINLAYLSEHGLIKAAWHKSFDGIFQPLDAAITAKGLDFLADDGGLSAILGVVTVKLHEDTLKAILLDAVSGSHEPETVKAKLVEQIKGLPAELTKQAVLEAAKAGLQAAPSLAAMLGRWLAP